MNWVTSEGIMFFSACGRITKRMPCAPERPSAVAASTCPRGTDWMPARTISPRYAASKITNAASATPNSGIVVLSTIGMMNHIQKITMTSGTPRKNSTYRTAGVRIHHCGARRAIPMKMPRMNPSRMDGIASRTVPPTKLPIPRKPCRSRNGRLRQMTSRSSMASADGRPRSARGWQCGAPPTP